MKPRTALFTSLKSCFTLHFYLLRIFVHSLCDIKFAKKKNEQTITIFLTIFFMKYVFFLFLVKSLIKKIDLMFEC